MWYNLHSALIHRGNNIFGPLVPKGRELGDEWALGSAQDVGCQLETRLRARLFPQIPGRYVASLAVASASLLDCRYSPLGACNKCW